MADVSGGVPRDFIPMFEWTNWFHQKQKDFLDSTKDYFEIAYVGGNGSGKTRILYHALTTLAIGIHPRQIAKPPLNIKVLVTDFEHGLNTVAQDTLFQTSYMPDGSEIGPMFPQSMVKSTWSKEDRSLKVDNGSVISFMTSEQKKQLHAGQNTDILANDEESKQGAYTESKRGLRNAKGGGLILHALTPPYEEGAGPSWTLHNIVEPWEEGLLPRTHVINACMADNPAVTKEFIEEYQRGLTDEEWRVRYYGEYPTWGKMCFGDFKRNQWDPETGIGNILPYDWPVPFGDENATFLFAIDWHSSKAAAVIWAVETSDGDIVIYDELSPKQTEDKTPGELTAIIHETEGHRFGKGKIPIRRLGDPKMKDKSNVVIRGANAWTMFRREGLFLTEGWNRQPESGIAWMNDYIRGDRNVHPRMFVVDGCTSVIHSIKNAYWIKNADGTGRADPKNNDYHVCVKYIVQDRAKGAQPYNKRNRRSRWPITSYMKPGEVWQRSLGS